MTDDLAKDAGAWLLADAAIRRASGAEARDIEALRRRFANVGYSAENMEPILKNAIVIRPTGVRKTQGAWGMEVNDSMVEKAVAEYRVALSSDPRNTDQMRNSPAWPRIIEAMQRDAMRDALTAALSDTGAGAV